MMNWILFGERTVDRQAQSDPDYQELLQEMESLNPVFDLFLNRLSPEDKELVLAYLNLAVDIEAQRTRIAYYIK